MACITNIRQILKRDGTNQFDRLPEAFNPSYVKIDEKTNEDLLQLISDFAGQVQFYNRENAKDGNWQAFFEDFSREYEPHIALMLTFLKLFQEARDHLNEIGQRHLDFYYRRFLQIQQRAALPDKVHLVIETAKNVIEHKLEKGTRFPAGKDANGKTLIYQSEREIVLNKAKVESLRSIFVDHRQQYAVYAAPVANSADGQGAAFETDEPKWTAFGERQSGLSVSQRTMTDANIGFAIASPALWLKEGTRTITINLHLNELPGKFNLKLKSLLNRKLNNALVAQLTGEKGWVGDFSVGISWNDKEMTLILTIIVEAAQPAIVGFDKEIHSGTFNTSQPLLKILANNELANHPYNWLRSLTFSQITFSVNVVGVKSLILQNELGLVDGEKPFQPFGPLPVKSSVFYIGCNEAFNKKLSSLKLRFKWKDLPENKHGFQDYYQYYNRNYQNDGFTFNHKFLLNANWASMENSSPKSLFSYVKISGKGVFLTDDEVSRTLNVEKIGFEQNEVRAAHSKFSHASKSGFIKLELTGQDFGHKEYPLVYAKQAVAMSKSAPANLVFTLKEPLKAKELQVAKAKKDVGAMDFNEVPIGKDILAQNEVQAVIESPTIKDILANKETTSLPNPPYTPVMEYLTLDYSCESLIDLADGTSPGNAFFHIQPFGEAEVAGDQDSTFQRLLPNFDQQGYFFIGLKDLKPPQNLSVLFQVAEDSADPEFIDDQQKIIWSFLTEYGWKEFNAGDIVSDSTNGLRKTGIIIFNFPKEASSLNRAMPEGLYWLCASYDGDVRGLNKMIGLYTQAVTAVFADQGNDPSHYDNPLKAESITKLLIQDSSVKKIIQPFASFGGQKPEQGSNYPIPFYTRVSERLRHKNRGVTIWDIERLVLQRFPDIYKVKALNHSSATTDTAPGNITIVVIEQVRNKNAVNPLQPRAGRNTLAGIKACASKYMSPFVEVHVQNPIYEEVKVDFKVAFKPGFDPGYYKTKLNEEIRQFLSPWAYQEGEDIVFGNVIYKSAIYYFVEKREYVDYVMDFHMSHIKPNWGIGCMEILDDFYVGADETLIDVDKAEPRTSRSILVSFPEHEIEIITNMGLTGENNLLC